MNAEDTVQCDGDRTDGIKLPEVRKRKRSIVSVMKDVIKQEKKEEKKLHRKESTANNGGRSIREIIMSLFHNASSASTSSEELSPGELRASRSLPSLFDCEEHANNCHCSQRPDSAITGSSTPDQNKLQAPSPDHRIHKGSWPSSRVDYTKSVSRKKEQISGGKTQIDSTEEGREQPEQNAVITKDRSAPHSPMTAPKKPQTDMEQKDQNIDRDSEIRRKVDQELKKILQGKRYHPELAKIWCRKLSDRVTKNIQELTNYKKKVVTAVYIGQVHGERVDVAVKCQRDSSTDNFVTVHTTGDHLYCWVSVIALDLPDNIRDS